MESDGPLIKLEQEMAGFNKKGFNFNLKEVEVAVVEVVVMGGQLQSHEEEASLLQPIQEEEEEETQTSERNGST